MEVTYIHCAGLDVHKKTAISGKYFLFISDIIPKCKSRKFSKLLTSRKMFL